MINLNLNKSIFNDVYFPYLTDYTNRTEVYYGGAGSGKSVFIAQKILYKSLKDKRIILVVRKTLVSQNRSCWKLLLDVLDQWQITKYCKINKSDYQITMPNGSIIYIAGIDNPERIKSIAGITDIWIEEATELTLDDYTQLQLRLRAEVDGSQVYCSFNPISKANWTYKLWFDDNVQNTGTVIIKTTYKDNKFLPQSYIDELEKMIITNPTYYRIYALGEFCTLDKLVYNNWKVLDFDEREITGDLVCGLDFGYTNDPTAFIVGIVNDKDKSIYILTEWYEKNKTNQEIGRAISALGHSKSTIIADSAEPKSIEELRRYGLYRVKESVKGKDSVLQGIQLLQQYSIYVKPNCQNIIAELENYTWQKDKDGEYINKPIDNFNHLLDALRYAMQCIGKGKLKSLSREVL